VNEILFQMHYVHCFDCGQSYEDHWNEVPPCCGACGSERIGVHTVALEPEE
jgi:predicted Zn-ribbon and HTH transcriptional regulator